MAGKKRTQLSEEEILKMIVPNWKKAKNLEEIQRRAEEGKTKFSHSIDKSLNAIWILFTKYPEVFLYQKYIYDTIIDGYMVKHVSISSPAHVQVSNMNEAIVKIRNVVEKLYSDVVEVIEDKVIEKPKNALNIFDDEEDIQEKSKPTGLVAKSTKAIRFTKEIQIKYADDKTPIQTFKPNSGDKLIKYLIEVRNVRTLSDFIKMYSNPRQRNAFYQKTASLPEEYEEFKTKVIDYANGNFVTTEFQGNSKGGNATEQNMSSQVSDSIKKNEIKNEGHAESVGSVSDKIEAIEDLKKFDAKRFEKDSKEMTEISQMVEELLSRLTDEYLTTGLTVAEVDNEMEAQLALFRKIVDEKRSELERIKAASFIKAKISEGVKYKRKDPKSRVHNHNPFTSDDFNI